MTKLVPAPTREMPLQRFLERKSSAKTKVPMVARSMCKRMFNCKTDVNHDVFVKGDEAAEWLSRALKRGQPRLLRRVQSCRRSAAGRHWLGSPGG